MLKQLLGRFGRGFYRLEYIDGDYYITGVKSSAEAIIALLKSINYYLVTEYVENHATIREIWPESTNTLRVLIGKVDDEITVIRSFMRFGNKKSNGVDNAHSGGIELIVDEETGDGLFAVQMDERGFSKRIDKHPDSGASFSIQVSRYKEVVKTCKEICGDYPELCYLGFDIAITQDSFKVLEINSLSGLMAAQLKMPLLKDSRTKHIYECFRAKHM